MVKRDAGTGNRTRVGAMATPCLTIGLCPHKNGMNGDRTHDRRLFPTIFSGFGDRCSNWLNYHPVKNAFDGFRTRI
jgi:hypothetical protein